jgi:catechol 2,3-dioxygenase-like lactoylglutathione lyase family enzyme
MIRLGLYQQRRPNGMVLVSFLRFLINLLILTTGCLGFAVSRPEHDKLTSMSQRGAPFQTVPLYAAASTDTSNLPLTTHHMALRTRNITVAIQFYSLLGFDVDAKFRAGPARAAWLTQQHEETSRLELIEVPSHMLQEPEGKKRRALDLMKRQDLLGWNHVALDVTELVQDGSLLADWIQELNDKSKAQFGKALRIASVPTPRIIGKHVYEIAFLYDADGGLVELLRKQKGRLEQDIQSGWEPWDGKGFVE